MHTYMSPSEKVLSSLKYMDEDWSDLISYNIGNDPTPASCIYGSYDDTDSLKNADSEDVHSGDFFRLLHHYTVKNGSLPEQCNQYLHFHDQKAGFKNCATWQTEAASAGE